MYNEYKSEVGQKLQEYDILFTPSIFNISFRPSVTYGFHLPIFIIYPISNYTQIGQATLGVQVQIHLCPEV